MSIAHNISTVGIAAVGATLVIISGGIDLSVGSVIALTVVSTGYFLKYEDSMLMAVCMALLAGGLVGAANGGLIAFLRLPPFIATLGMLSIARGIAFGITGGQNITGFYENPWVAFLGQERLLGVPVAVHIMILIALGGWLFLGKTSIGRQIIAIGGNEEASRLTGIHIRRIKVLIYTIAGLTAAVAGILYTCRYGYASSTAGRGDELEVIAAVVIGGTSLTGGRGTILGTLLGAALMGCLQVGLVTYGVMDQYIELAIGTVIILAVLVDIWQNRLKENMG